MRAEVRGQGKNSDVILNLSGDASGKMNRNFQTYCIHKSLVIGLSMCIERILGALYH